MSYRSNYNNNGLFCWQIKMQLQFVAFQFAPGQHETPPPPSPNPLTHAKDIGHGRKSGHKRAIHMQSIHKNFETETPPMWMERKCHSILTTQPARTQNIPLVLVLGLSVLWLRLWIWFTIKTKQWQLTKQFKSISGRKCRLLRRMWLTGNETKQAKCDAISTVMCPCVCVCLCR